MNDHHMDSFDENCWSNLINFVDLLDDVAAPSDLYWIPRLQPQNVGMAADDSLSRTTSQVRDCVYMKCPRKRGHSDPCGGIGAKSIRERTRREKMNARFCELSATLEPGRPLKSDKLAILSDAIRILNQLGAESQEYTEMNKRLLEEIKTLKAEKNELRQEKLMLKTHKERMEQQLKILNVPPGFMPSPPPLYPAEVKKVPIFPSYGFVPMWQYLPPSAHDTSQDQELRPPAA